MNCYIYILNYLFCKCINLSTKKFIYFLLWMYFVVKMPFTHSNFIDYRTSRVRRRTTYLRLDPQNWPDSPPGPSQRPKRNPQRSPQSWPGLSTGQIGRETRLIPLFTSTKNTNRYKWCWLKVERERGELDKFVLKFNFFFHL